VYKEPTVLKNMPHTLKPDEQTGDEAQGIGAGRNVERVWGRNEEWQQIKAPGLPHIKMIDPDGHVVFLPVRSTRNVSGAAKAGVNTDSYQSFIMRKKNRKNWLVYENVPADQVEKVIADRRAAATEASAAHNRAHTPQNVHVLAYLEEMRAERKDMRAEMETLRSERDEARAKAKKNG